MNTGYVTVKSKQWKCGKEVKEEVQIKIKWEKLKFIVFSVKFKY